MRPFLRHLAHVIAAPNGLALALVSLVSLLPDPAHAFPDTIGGDDRLAMTAPDIASGAGFSMDIAENGDVYLAVQVNDPANGPQIRVYRSQNGGDSFALWGSLIDGDGFSGTGYGQPSVLVAEGTQNRLYVAYTRTSLLLDSSIGVAWSSLNLASASFTLASAMAQTGVDFSFPDLASDEVTSADYKLFLVARGDDGDAPDIWFARSINFDASWEAEYKIGDVIGATHTYNFPRVAFGRNGFVHCAWTYIVSDAGFDNAVRYRRASNSANAGIADWGLVTGLTSTTDGVEDGVSCIATSHGDGSGVILYSGANDGITRIQTTLNDGGLWTVQPDLGSTIHTDMVALPGTGGFRCGGEYVQQAMLQSATNAAPGIWTNEAYMADGAHSNTSIGAEEIDYDVSRGNRIGMAWVSRHAAEDDSIFFDAEWRADPGYPNYYARFPRTIASGAASAPVIANLNDDGFLEIAYADLAGNVQVHALGAPMAGWPKPVGTVALHAAVAVADLDGDIKNDVVVGVTNQVFAFHADGTTIPGFPVTLGTARPAFVSLGAISNVSPHQIVVTSGNKLFVIKADGTPLAPFPVTLPQADIAVAPAAIGDIDADGQMDIAAGNGAHVYGINAAGVTEFDWSVTGGQKISDAPTLADVDLNGDLELAFPTNQGNVYLFKPDGTIFGAGWPVSDPSGTPATSVAFGNLAGLAGPELAWAVENQSVQLRGVNGVSFSGWPHATSPGFLLTAGPTLETTDNGSPDVIVGSKDQSAYGWNNLTTNVPGWPKSMDGQINVSAASGDLNLDHKVEVVFVTSTKLIVLATNGTIDRADPLGQWPMYAYNAARTGCLACKPDAVTSVREGARAGMLQLEPPVPNPATGAIGLRFTLPVRASVKLGVYDLAGREIRVLADGDVESGAHAMAWDGRGESGARVTAGIYYVRLSLRGASASSETRRVAVLR